MTREERVRSLHMRMKIRRRRQEQKRTAVLGGICALLAACLALLVRISSARMGMPPGLLTGSSMLFEDAGGYVLIAVIAFMTGVVITVILKWNLETKKRCEREKQEEHEGIGYLEDDTLLQAAGGKTGDKEEPQNHTGDNKQF